MMTHVRPFNEVKLQWLALLSQDKTLSSTAIVIAVYIVTVHYNQDKGVAWPSYATIASATGKTIKTVQRSIKELAGTWFDVKRGNGLGHSTQFAPSGASIQAATALRHNHDKLVRLYPVEGGQKRPQRVTNLSSDGGQKCPPNQETQSRYEKSAQQDVTQPRDFVRLFVELGSTQARSWNNWLAINGMQNMESLFPVAVQHGCQGCYMPSRYPPIEFQECQRVLQHMRSACICPEFISIASNNI